jgi:hypothetical protein
VGFVYRPLFAPINGFVVSGDAEESEPDGDDNAQDGSAGQARLICS